MRHDGLQRIVERLSARRCVTASMRPSPSTTNVGDGDGWMRVNVSAGRRGVA